MTIIHTPTQALEFAIYICEAEKLEALDRHPEDLAYNQAIDDCIGAIRKHIATGSGAASQPFKEKP